MGEDQTRTVFISRAGADAPLAAEIGRILEAEGYRVILQQWDFANHSFVQQMHDALTGGGRVVALLSPAYLGSDYCAAEWQAVLAEDPLNKKSRLVVLRIAECKPPGLLAALTYCDLVPVLGNAPLLTGVVRDAVREGRRKDEARVAGPYWRAPRTISNAEAVSETPSFTGREDELERLDVALWQGGGVAALYGLGGTGKSALAREYARRNLDRYAVVWRFTADSETGIVDGLVRLGAHLEAGLENTPDRPAVARQVTDTMLTGFERPVLLVFDNLDDEALLRAWRPAGAQVIVTSRNAAWSSSITAVRLGTWPLGDGIDYLQRESNRADIVTADFRAIAETLDRLPLALVHAAAHLKRSKAVTARRYLERINVHLANAPKGVGYGRAVFATFHEAMAKAEEEAPGSAAVMCFIAFFAPDAIPEELLRQTIEVYPEGLRPRLPDAPTPVLDLRSAVAHEARIEEVLSELDRLSLIVFLGETRTATVHRLVQAAGRALLGPDHLSWLSSAIAAMTQAFPGVTFETWKQCAKLLPHARAALAQLPHNEHFSCAGLLATRCGMYLYQRAAFAEAELLFLRALVIDEASYGFEHPAVARDLNNLAELLRATNRLGEAEPLYQRALTISEASYGPDHPSVAVRLNNLAELLRATNRLGEAEPLYRRALAISEASYGPEHPTVAICLNNLAGLLRQTNRLGEAEPLFLSALAIDEASYGPEHPAVAVGLNNLAGLLRVTNRLGEAEQLYRRALTISEASYGPEHPTVSTCLNNLASLLRETNRLGEAEPLFRHALAISEASYGPEHPTVAVRLNNLAGLLHGTNRLGEAEPLYRRALAISEASYGPEHPTVATCLGNLAELLYADNRPGEAEPLDRRAKSLRQAPEAGAP